MSFDSQDINYLDEGEIAKRYGQPLSPLKGQNVLVTGGAGAFGRAFVRRALDEGARRVVVFSRDEAKHAKMRAEFTDPRLRYFVGDVREKWRLMEAFSEIDIVVHAAAMKRVETCEENPREAKRTNIDGTENVATACIERGVKKAVFLSTDKAASPNTLYGATKLYAERYWIASNAMAAGKKTRFACTRYGNVLGSTGSVIPTWRAQAERGEMISMTAPDMTRFWMPMTQAVDLVLMALRNMRGGEVFIPKAGSSSVAGLAQAVAPDAAWAIKGTRPGEKMHELLISSDEARTTYDCGTHYVIEPDSRPWGELRPPPFPKVPEGFEYGSANNPKVLSVDELRELAA